MNAFKFALAALVALFVSIAPATAQDIQSQQAAVPTAVTRDISAPLVASDPEVAQLQALPEEVDVKAQAVAVEAVAQALGLSWTVKEPKEEPFVFEIPLTEEDLIEYAKQAVAKSLRTTSLSNARAGATVLPTIPKVSNGVKVAIPMNAVPVNSIQTVHKHTPQPSRSDTIYRFGMTQQEALQKVQAEFKAAEALRRKAETFSLASLKITSLSTREVSTDEDRIPVSTAMFARRVGKVIPSEPAWCIRVGNGYFTRLHVAIIAGLMFCVLVILLCMWVERTPYQRQQTIQASRAFWRRWSEGHIPPSTASVSWSGDGSYAPIQMSGSMMATAASSAEIKNKSAPT